MLFGAAVDREWLDEKHGASGRETLAGIARRTDRIAHVVQAVEEADEVVLARVRRRGRDLELRAVHDAGFGRAFLRSLDRPPKCPRRSLSLLRNDPKGSPIVTPFVRVYCHPVVDNAVAS